ncbi:GA module-containing protein [Mycoplasmopsis synoviae]|uniref:GA module-containing protein n=1 Tax=Mycoplasmopsis synoviae TaxID=2109 RepID=UPI001CE2069C|nr:GA module-containing protein [Mycoplasmopsis synoviae]UBX97245.1 GA module-containing protein [Mycoplasmopsis synoviae]
MKNKKIKLLLAASAVAIAPAVIAISCGDQTPAPTPAPTPTPGNPNTDNPQNPNPGNPGGGTVDPVETAKTEAKTAIDASAELSDSVKEALKRQVEATTTESAARDLKTKAEALVSAVKALSGSVTAAKAVKEDAEYSKVTDTTHKTTLEAKLTAAISLLEGETKLKNLDASSNLVTTKASLESAKTALDAAVDAVKPDLEFQKTKTSAAAKVTELESLVNSALKAELQRQVNELTKEQAAQATTMLANLTSLKESLESLQTLVSDGLKMQVDYPRNYYDADNKADFDAALLKASSVFPTFQWTDDSIVVPTPTDGALPNPRAWTKARDKSEFVLQNFVMAPAQAAAPTTAQTSPSAAASATVRLATGTEEAAQAPQTPAADLASTVSYLKSLNDTLKAATDALNGDNPTEKTAYYKPVNGRTLYWDGFMPKIVVQGYEADGEEKGKATHKEANQKKLEDWFAANQDKLSLVAEQLTKKLGEEKFKNMVLSTPTISWDEVKFSNRLYLTPKVTFNLAAKEEYEKSSDSLETVTLTIRNLYKAADPNTNLFATQGASSSATPNNASQANDATTIEKVNVYLNYTGPNIELNAELPQVGFQENTSINGTSNVDDAFNNAFRGNPSSGLLFTDRYPNPLLKSVINYVNKFDPKYRATFVTDSKNGVTITKVQNTKELRPGTLDDLNGNNVFLQQMKNDTEAVYLPVTAIASNGWLNTFLIRIPLTKFVRPLTEFRPTTPTSPSSDTQQQTGETQDSQPAGQNQ